jgi:hypothetical protein
LDAQLTHLRRTQHHRREVRIRHKTLDEAGSTRKGLNVTQLRVLARKRYNSLRVSCRSPEAVHPEVANLELPGLIKLDGSSTCRVAGGGRRRWAAGERLS